MAELGGFLGFAKGGSGGGFDIANLLTNIGTIILAVIAIGAAGYFVYYMAYKKRNWNLKVGIKIPRSNGNFYDFEFGKGNYNENKGVCFIKRKGKKAVAMKPFDVKKYVIGKSYLEVVQVSPGEYLPILQESYSHVVDDTTGEEAAVVTLKGDLSKSKAWKNSFEREAKTTFSITNLLKEYLPYIGFGIVIMMNFVGFTILSRALK